MNTSLVIVACGFLLIGALVDAQSDLAKNFRAYRRCVEKYEITPSEISRFRDQENFCRQKEFGEHTEDEPISLTIDCILHCVRNFDQYDTTNRVKTCVNLVESGTYKSRRCFLDELIDARSRRPYLRVQS